MCHRRGTGYKFALRSHWAKRPNVFLYLPSESRAAEHPYSRTPDRICDSRETLVGAKATPETSQILLAYRSPRFIAKTRAYPVYDRDRGYLSSAQSEIRTLVDLGKFARCSPSRTSLIRALRGHPYQMQTDLAISAPGLCCKNVFARPEQTRANC